MMLNSLRFQALVAAAALASQICLGNEGRESRSGLPFVSVQATVPLASEPGDNPGAFTLYRRGDTNSTLTVDFSLGGTASNGVDYAALPTSITFAAGQDSTNLAVTPVSDPTASGYKTVVLTLPRGRSGRGSGAPEFVSGPLNRALVYLVYNYTNMPPSVSLISPSNGSSFLSRPNIVLTASASDSNGWVTSVQFLANGSGLGVISNSVLDGFAAQPVLIRESHGSLVPMQPGGRDHRYQFVWANVPPGAYALTAVAMDNAGLQTTSAVVEIDVTTNLPVPNVRIINPVNGTEYPEAAPINVYAAAGETNGVVDTVEFFANGVSLGTATNYLATEPGAQLQVRFHWLPYYFPWTNAPVGSNVLTAVATDNNGTTATSAPVNINVTTNMYRRRHR